MRKIKIKNSKRYSVLPMLLGMLLSISQFAQADDMLTAVERAYENDRQWRAAKAIYEATRLAGDQGSAALRPTVTAMARTSTNNYRSDSTQIRVDPDASGFDPACGANFNCIIQGFLGIQLQTDTNEDFTSRELNANLTQPLWDMERWYYYKMNKAAELRAEAELRAAEQEMLFRVSEAYINVLRSLDQLDLAVDEERALNAQLQTAKTRYQQGIDEDTEIYDAQSAYDLRLDKLAYARATLTAATSVLAGITGTVDAAVARLDDKLPIVAPSPNKLSAWIETAEKYNPVLISQLYKAEEAKHQYRQKKSGHLPKVKFFANYNITETSGGQGFQPGSETRALGIEVSMPLYNGGNDVASSKQNYYRYSAEQERLKAERLVVENKVLESFTKVNADVERVEARRRSIRSTEKSLAAAKRSYEDGRRNVLDLTNVQTSYFMARLDLAASRYDYMLNSLRLKKASGILSMDDLVALNQWLTQSGSKP